MVTGRGSAARSHTSSSELNANVYQIAFHFRWSSSCELYYSKHHVALAWARLFETKQKARGKTGSYANVLLDIYTKPQITFLER